MIFIFGLVIVLASLAFVAYPLVRKPEKVVLDEDKGEEELLFKRDSTYSALKELEFDYALGNLSPQDHRELKEKYKEKAIGILKEMDGLKEEVSERRVPAIKVQDDIEKEIMLFRKGKAEDLEEEILAARKRPREEIACPSCGSGVSREARYCSSCGAAVALLCSSCSKPVKRGDKFCSECGTEIVQSPGS